MGFINLTGLTPGKTYDIVVRAKSPDGIVSVNSLAYTFTAPSTNIDGTQLVATNQSVVTALAPSSSSVTGGALIAGGLDAGGAAAAGALNLGSVWNGTASSIAKLTGTANTGAVVINSTGILGYQLTSTSSGQANFFLDTASGNAYFRGTIYAASGQIGGFNIGSTSLYNTASGNTISMNAGLTGEYPSFKIVGASSSLVISGDESYPQITFNNNTSTIYSNLLIKAGAIASPDFGPTASNNSRGEILFWGANSSNPNQVTIRRVGEAGNGPDGIAFIDLQTNAIPTTPDDIKINIQASQASVTGATIAPDDNEKASIELYKSFGNTSASLSPAYLKMKVSETGNSNTITMSASETFTNQALRITGDSGTQNNYYLSVISYAAASATAFIQTPYFGNKPALILQGSSFPGNLLEFKDSSASLLSYFNRYGKFFGSLEIVDGTLNSSSATFNLLSTPTTITAFGGVTTLDVGPISGIIGSRTLNLFTNSNNVGGQNTINIGTSSATLGSTPQIINIGNATGTYNTITIGGSTGTALTLNATASVTGKITAASFVGNGAGLTGITASATGSVTIGSTTIGLGGTSTSLTGLTSVAISNSNSTTSPFTVSTAINNQNLTGRTISIATTATSTDATTPIGSNINISTNAITTALTTGTATGGNIIIQTSGTGDSTSPGNITLSSGNNFTITAAGFAGAMNNFNIGATTPGTGNFTALTISGSSVATQAYANSASLNAYSQASAFAVTQSNSASSTAYNNASAFALTAANSASLNAYNAASAYTATGVHNNQSASVKYASSAGFVLISGLSASTITIGSTIIGLGNTSTSLSGLNSISASTISLSSSITATSASVSGTVTAASFVGSGAGLTGLMGALVYSASFASASAISFNNVFSSSYTNYKIIITFSAITYTGSTYTPIKFAFRAAGVDSLGAGTYNSVYQGYSSFALGYSASSFSSNSFIYGPAVVVLSVGQNLVLEAYGPATTTTRKEVVSQSYQMGNPGGTYTLSHTGYNTSASAFDGFSLLSSSSNNNYTGTIKIYGYNN